MGKLSKGKKTTGALDFEQCVKELQRAEAPIGEESLTDEPSPEERAASDVARLLKLGVPRRDAQDAASPQCQRTRSVIAVEKCLRECPTATLVLSGGQLGIGKTVASAVWLLGQIRARRSKGRNCRMWVDAVKLCRWSVYDGDGELQALEEAPLLAIQDLGEEAPARPKDWQGQLTTLINARQRNDLPTCITTNLSAKEAHELYAERLYDRLKQHARWVSVGGNNLRRALGS